MSDWSSDVCSSDLSNYRRVESSTCHLPSCIAAPTWHYRWWFNHGGTPRNSIRLQGTDFRRPSHMDAEKPFLRPKKRSEEHTSELQSLMRISYAVFCLKKKKKTTKNHKPSIRIRLQKTTTNT